MAFVPLGQVKRRKARAKRTTTDEVPIFTTAQAAEFLGIGKKTLNKMIQKGDLPLFSKGKGRTPSTVKVSDLIALKTLRDSGGVRRVGRPAADARPQVKNPRYALVHVCDELGVHVKGNEFETLEEATSDAVRYLKTKEETRKRLDNADEFQRIEEDGSITWGHPDLCEVTVMHLASNQVFTPIGLRRLKPVKKNFKLLSAVRKRQRELEEDAPFNRLLAARRRLYREEQALKRR
jgi:excisionase family DNA binding protein